MKHFDPFPDRIEQAFEHESIPKFFVNKNDSRITESDRYFDQLQPDFYEKALLEIIIALSSEERKIFLQKHLYCYSNRNIRWFNKLKELIAEIEFSGKDEFIEIINQYVKDLELVKKLDFLEQGFFVLKKLAEPDTGIVDYAALLGLERMAANDVGQYLYKSGYIRLLSQGYAEIKPEGRARLASLEAEMKPVKAAIQNLQKQLEGLEEDSFDFLDWCDKTSRYLDFANEYDTIQVIEKHKKNINSINISDFKLDMSKRIINIIDLIKESKRLRTPYTTIMNQENNINNSGNMSIVNGHGNNVTQTNAITNTKLSETELKKLIAETTEALKSDLPNLQLDNDDIEELKKQIKELESLQAAPLTKKSGWKLGTIKDILKGAVGGTLGDAITQHAGKVETAITALSQWLSQ